MSKIPKFADEAVFPQPHRKALGMNEAREIVLPAQWGLTKREYFAAVAMQGLLMQERPTLDSTTESMANLCADEAVKCADALLARLSVG